MRLFLFSASVFYLLGLKLTSQIDIHPVFYHKPAQIETKTTPAPQPDIQEKPAPIRTDTLHSPGTKSNPLTAPSGKKNGEVTGQPHPKV
jgi:hypothetical protein